MRYLNPVSVRDTLCSIKISKIKHGSQLTPSCGPYGAYTIQTEDGREYVLWQAYGEINLSQVIGFSDENPTK